MVIKIVDWSKIPGGRYKANGDNSAEEYRDRILLPAYQQARKNNDALIVDLDGGYGYAASFLEELFGGLVRIVRSPDASERITLISHEEPSLIPKIRKYMEEALVLI